MNYQRAEQSRLLGDKLRSAAFGALDTILELAQSGGESTKLKARQLRRRVEQGEIDRFDDGSEQPLRD